MNPSRYTSTLILLASVALMALTRSHHFSSTVTLPDASLALFFIAGWLLAGGTAFVVLVVAAVAIDFFAVNVGGIGAYCLSPAYPFLLLAYGAMWFGGRLVRQHQGHWSQRAGLIAISAVASTLVAYGVSEMSFFWFSGEITAPLSEYLASAWHYLPSYLGSSLSYVAIAALLALLVQHLSHDRLGNTAH